MSRLNAVLQKLSSYPQQHTEEWHAARRHCVGGSQIGVFTGSDRWTTVDELVEEKMGSATHVKSGNSLPMLWGSFFESPLRCHVSGERAEEIVGSSSFIGSTQRHPHLCFSPDGLSEDSNGRVRLFEFKCPVNRIPLETNRPLMRYVDQLRLGMALFAEVGLPIESGLLIEAVFRRCTSDHIASDSSFVPCAGQCPHTFPRGATHAGFAVFDGLEENAETRTIDFGWQSDDMLSGVFGLVERGEATVIHSRLMAYPLDLEAYEIEQSRLTTRKTFGLLHYKLMAVVSTEVSHDDAFLARVEPLVNARFSVK